MFFPNQPGSEGCPPKICIDKVSYELRSVMLGPRCRPIIPGGIGSVNRFDSVGLHFWPNAVDSDSIDRPITGAILALTRGGIGSPNRFFFSNP